jgi:hypothetical protein
MVAALDAVEVTAVSDDELVEVMAAWRRVTSWAQAGELAAVAELVRRREAQHASAPPVELGEFIADEIALALTLSGGAAGMWAGLACKLADPLPLTRRALAEGRIDLTRARVIADGLLGVEPGTAELVERAVIDDAQRVPAARLRHRVREAIKAVDPQAAEQREKRARKVRSLEKWATAAGTCDLAFREMSEEDAEAVFNRINAVAQAMKADGDARPIDAIRHDLGVALLRGTPLPEAANDLHHTDEEDDHGNARPGNTRPQNTHHENARSKNTRPENTRPDNAGQVKADRVERENIGQEDPHPDRGDPGTGHPNADRATPWAGRKGSAWSARPAGPGRIHGGDTDRGDALADQITGLLAGIIDERLDSVADRHRATGRRTGLALRIGTAMQAITSALTQPKEHWCRTTTGQDPTGAATGTHGHPGYRPPAAMRRMIDHNHPVCAFPTCDRPAPRCDADHTIAWHQGGPTCPCNMSNLCRRHHRLKQHPQWHLFQPWPNLLIWVTPAGKWHTVIPENRQ